MRRHFCPASTLSSVGQRVLLNGASSKCLPVPKSTAEIFLLRRCSTMPNKRSPSFTTTNRPKPLPSESVLKKTEEKKMSVNEMQESLTELEGKVRRFQALKPLLLLEIITNLRQAGVSRQTETVGNLMQRSLKLVRHVGGSQGEIQLLLHSLSQEPESFEYALALYDNMKRLKMNVTVEMFDTLLQGAGRWRFLSRAKDLLHDFSTFISSQDKEAQLRPPTLSALVYSFAKEGDDQMVLHLWDRIKQTEAPPSLKAACAMMELHLRRRSREEEIEAIFNYTKNSGVEPDAATYSLLARAYAKSNLDKAFQVLSLAAKYQFPVDSKLLNILIRACAERGRFDLIDSLLDPQKNSEIETSSSSRNEVSVNSEDTSSPIPQDRLKAYRKLSTDSLDDLIRQCLVYEETEKARLIIKRARKVGVEPSIGTTEALIEELAQKGLVVPARAELDTLLQRRDYKAHRRFMDNFLYACGQAGYPSVALGFFEEAANRGAKLEVSQVVYDSLVSALAAQSRMKQADEMMKVMEGKGMTPNGSTYAAMIKGYVRKGLPQQALSTMWEMMERKVTPEEGLLEFLLAVLVRMKDLPNASLVADVITRMGIKPSADTFTSLLQLGLEKRDSDLVGQLVKGMKEAGITMQFNKNNIGIRLFDLSLEKEDSATLQMFLDMIDMGVKGDDDKRRVLMKDIPLERVFELGKKKDDKELMVKVLERMEVKEVDTRKDLCISLLSSFFDSGELGGYISVAEQLDRAGNVLDEDIVDKLFQLLLKENKGEWRGVRVVRLLWKQKGKTLSSERWKVLVEACREDKDALAELLRMMQEAGVEDSDEATVLLRQCMPQDEQGLREQLLSGCATESDRHSAAVQLRAMRESQRELGDYPAMLVDICLVQNDWRNLVEALDVMTSAKGYGDDVTSSNEDNQLLSRVLEASVSKGSHRVMMKVMEAMNSRGCPPPSKVLDGVVGVLVQKGRVTECVNLLYEREKKEREGERWDLTLGTWHGLLSALVVAGSGGGDRGQEIVAGCLEVLRMMDERDHLINKVDGAAVEKMCNAARVLPSRALFHFKLQECVKKGGGDLKEVRNLLRQMKKARLAPTEKTLLIIAKVCREVDPQRVSKKDIKKVVQTVEAQGLPIAAATIDSIVNEVWEQAQERNLHQSQRR